MQARLQSSKAKRMKKLRSSTVEPVLVTLVKLFKHEACKHERLKTVKLMHADGGSGLQP